MINYLNSTKDYQMKNIRNSEYLRNSEIKTIKNSYKIISENGKRHLTSRSILTGGRARGGWGFCNSIFLKILVVCTRKLAGVSPAN
jgi:hypothetical protein